ncbi:MAG: hypothetical protein HY747_02980 [Elusimicrobia bacterium]|nr:hypothetical protein [Elusimicrobiota bacterium]
MNSVRCWFLFLLAGLILFFIMAAHMATFHLSHFFGIHEPLSYDSVMARSQQALFLIFYLIGLSAAVYHGLYGFRRILMELSLGRSLEKLVTAGLCVAGSVMVLVGMAATVMAFLQ